MHTYTPLPHEREEDQPETVQVFLSPDDDVPSYEIDEYGNIYDVNTMQYIYKPTNKTN